MTKSEIRKLETRAREFRKRAGDEVAKASDLATDDNVEGFATSMAEVMRLTVQSAKMAKQARAAVGGPA